VLGQMATTQNSLTADVRRIMATAGLCMQKCEADPNLNCEKIALLLLHCPSYSCLIVTNFCRPLAL
jgi:hypothetical protein